MVVRLRELLVGCNRFGCDGVGVGWFVEWLDDSQRGKTEDEYPGDRGKRGVVLWALQADCPWETFSFLSAIWILFQSPFHLILLPHILPADGMSVCEFFNGSTFLSTSSSASPAVKA